MLYNKLGHSNIYSILVYVLNVLLRTRFIFVKKLNFITGMDAEENKYLFEPF